MKPSELGNRLKTELLRRLKPNFRVKRLMD